MGTGRRVIGWGLPLILCSLASAAEPVRCALVVENRGDLRSSALLSLLEVQLSQDSHLQLVERERINAILQEQHLSLAGLVERDSAIKAGQLLRVRAFVLLSAENVPGQNSGPNSLLIRVRVAETAHGLRLWEGYEQLDGSNAETVVQHIAKEVTAATDRLSLPAGQMVPIGIIDIHRVQLDERHDLLTRALPRLLSARLSREPKILILERENLGLLLKEKQLTEGEDTAFWDSGILVDGHLQRADGGGLEMTLRWRRAGKEGAIVTRVDPNAPAGAVDAAATEILKAAMETPSSARWEPQKEADEFLRQGELLRAHGWQERAFAPFEAAYALQPEKVSYAGTLFENEWELRGYMFAISLIAPTRVSHYSDEQLAELVSRLVRDVRRGWETGTLSARDLCAARGTPLWLRSGRWTYFVHRASVSSAVVQGMNRTNRRIWFDVMDQVLRTRPITETFPLWLYERTELPWLSGDDPRELMDNIRKVYNEVILPPVQGGVIESNDFRCRVCEKALLGRGLDLSTASLHESQLCGAEAQVRMLWFSYLDELAQGNDPFVRFCACAARAEASSYDPDPSPPTTLQLWQKAAQALTDSPIPDPVKLHLCTPLKETLVRALGSEPSHLVEVWESVYAPLIDRKDARALTWWDPGNRSVPLDARELPASMAQRFRDLLARIEAVLEIDKNENLTAVVLGRVRDCRAVLESRYGLSGPGTSPSPIHVTMLLPRKDRSVSPPTRMYEVQWQLVGKMLHVAGAGESGRLFMARVDLTGQTRACLILPQVLARWATLAGFVVADEGSYVAVRDSGIVVLPHDVWNGQGAVLNAKILTKQHGLPSLLLTGMAGDRGRLWLAYGQSDAESGLGLYDPQTGRWETVLCSTLQGAEPFDAGRPYSLMHLAMPSADNLFFINYTRMFRGMQPWAGLWRLDTTTRALKYYGACENEETPWAHLDVAGKDCWFRGSTSLIRFDTQSEEAAYVLGREWRPAVRRAPRIFHWLDCRNDLFLPEASMADVPFLGIHQRGTLDLANCAIHGDDLWALLGDAQIAVLHRGKPFAEAQVIRNDILEGEAVRRFVSTPYGLVAIGDGVIGVVETKNSQPVPPE